MRETRPSRTGAAAFWALVTWIHGLALLIVILAAWLCVNRLTSGGFAVSTLLKMVALVAAGAFGVWALRTGHRRAQLSAVILVVLLLLLGQAVLHPERTSRWPAGDLRAPSPYVMFAGRPGAADHNPLGYRGDLPLLPKPAGERRVFVLGGSTVYDRLPKLVERELSRRTDAAERIRVHNWGIVSAASGQELAALFHHAAAFEPDLVVFYDGANDVANPWSYDPRPNHPFNYFLEEGALRLLQERNGLAWAAATFAQSHALTLVFSTEIDEALTRRSDRARRAERGSRPWEDRVLQAYLRNHDLACGLSRGLGFRIAFCLQPLVIDKGDPTTEEARLLEGLGPEMSAYLRRQYDRLRAIWSDRSARASPGTCAYLDLSRVFEAGHPERVFTDFVHVTAEGDATIARALATALREAGLL